MQWSKIVQRLERANFTMVQLILEARGKEWTLENITELNREIDRLTEARGKASHTLQVMREARGLTEAEVAEAMGVSEKRYVALEQAPGKMRISHLESLSRVLGFATPGDLADRVKFS